MADIMKVIKTIFAKGSLQNNTLETLITIKKNTQTETQSGC